MANHVVKNWGITRSELCNLLPHIAVETTTPNTIMVDVKQWEKKFEVSYVTYIIYSPIEHKHSELSQGIPFMISHYSALRSSKSSNSILNIRWNNLAQHVRWYYLKRISKNTKKTT